MQHEVEASVAELVREADSDAAGGACDEGPRGGGGVVGATEVAGERGGAEVGVEECGYFEG